MSKLLKNNWIKAIILNLIVLGLVLLCTDMAYETNDDYAISMRVIDGYPYISFINYYLMKLLIGIQALTSSVNVFVLFQIVMSFVSFTIITWILMEKHEDSRPEGSRASNIIFMVCVGIILLLFAIDQYSLVQFTKSSILILAAGLLLLIDSFIEKRGIGYYVVAFVLIYFGFMLRYMNIFVAIAFAGVYLVAWVISKNKALRPEGYLSVKMITIFVISCALLAGTGLAYQQSNQANKSSDELKAYSEFDYYRQFVCDYPIAESYEDNKAAFDEIGIDDNDLYLASNWYLDYDGASSTENLKKIYEIYSNSHGSGEGSAFAKAVKSTKSFVRSISKSVLAFDRTGVHIILLVLLALAYLIAYKPKHFIYVVVIGGLTALFYVYLYYLGRPAYRATYAMDLEAAVWLIYYMSSLKGSDMRQWTVAKPRLSAVAALVLCAVIGVGILQIADTGSRFKDSAVAGQMSEEMAEFLEENDGNFYVFGNGLRGRSPYYAEPLAAPPENYMANVLGFGSWGSYSPYLLNKLAAYGMENTFGDLIDNEKAFIFEEANVDRLTEYLNKWYGTSVGAEIEIVNALDEDGDSIVVGGQNVLRVKVK